MIKKESKKVVRSRRQIRVRKKILGTAARPRLCVSRSLTNIYAQIINDEAGKTLVACSSISPELKDKLSQKGNVAAAKQVGQLIAQKAKSAGINKVVFDRAGYLYHGRVKALAEGAREGGLEF
ncbi:MAG: 50S ribosomal protein L18 [bacterium]